MALDDFGEQFDAAHLRHPNVGDQDVEFGFRHSL